MKQEWINRDLNLVDGVATRCDKALSISFSHVFKPCPTCLRFCQLPRCYRRAGKSSGNRAVRPTQPQPQHVSLIDIVPACFDLACPSQDSSTLQGSSYSISSDCKGRETQVFPTRAVYCKNHKPAISESFRFVESSGQSPPLHNNHQQHHRLREPFANCTKELY
jgi:hypothetical protein